MPPIALNALVLSGHLMLGEHPELEHNPRGKVRRTGDLKHDRLSL